MARMRTISATIFATLACVADMTAAVISLSACVAFAEPSLPKGHEAWLEFVDGFVHKERTALRIEVTNTWRNRVVYDLGQPEKDRKTWIINRPDFNPHPTDPFVPSGILGPVVLRSVEHI